MPTPWAHLPDPLVLTTFNGAFARSGLVANWLASVRRVGLGEHVVLFALDAEAEAFGHATQATTVRLARPDIEPAPEILVFRRTGWRGLVLAKLDAIRQVFGDDRTVLFSDADIVFLQDPRPHLAPYDADVIAQSDVRPGRTLSQPKRPWHRFKPLRRRVGSTLCSGFMHVRPTVGTLKAFDTSRRDTARYISDQPLLHDRLVWRREATWALLPEATFPNGAQLSRARWLEGDAALDPVVIVHANWCRAARKVPLLKELGLWTVGDAYP